MNDNKEKWIQDVFDSLEGSKRATPPSHLLSKIEQNLVAPEAKIIPMSNYRIAVAAAVVLLVMNVFVMYQYAQTSTNSFPESMTDNTESLITDYKLYDL